MAPEHVEQLRALGYLDPEPGAEPEPEPDPAPGAPAPTASDAPPEEGR
jgi:hypothetical protein